MAGDISRRDFTKGLIATAGLAGLVATGCIPPPRSGLGPGSRVRPELPEGTELLPEIKHIVIYMQENHSYDSYFGMLRRGDGYTLQNGVPVNSNPDTTGNQVEVFHAPDTCQLGRGVSQSWSSTHKQVDGGRMDGFLFDDNLNAMRFWDGTDVPFYYSLANTFPICDRWFASAPAQTYPNRMYLQAATCQGLISTDVQKALAMPPPKGGTIWDKLNKFGISWHDYAWDLPDILLFPSVYSANQDKIRTFPQFLADCRDGTLPSVSIVSPGVNSYTEENPADIQLGEAYSALIINALMQSPAWESTVLCFMYDEHGGYYDHVPPPFAIPPDRIPPDVAPAPNAAPAWNMYGVRVPGFVVSPFSRPNYVSHVVHDHTSVLRLIETKWNLGALTYRDANASNLLDCLDLKNPSFAKPPTLAAPGLPATGSTCTPNIPPPPTSADLSTTSVASLEAQVAATSARSRTRQLSDTQRAWIELGDAMGVRVGN
jgi:phospholipase C